jgi:hypothetical protein
MSVLVVCVNLPCVYAPYSAHFAPICALKKLCYADPFHVESLLTVFDGPWQPSPAAAFLTGMVSCQIPGGR